MTERADFKKRVRNFTFKALKATVKGLLFYAVYFILWTFLAPLSQIIPGLQQTVEIFVAAYIALIIIGELVSGTIFQYFFNAAKALFVICYLILSLKGGIFSITYKNVNLAVDLRIFLVVVTLLSLLGFAKSMLQAIDYLNNNVENTHL
ncbi:MAG: hypothetical protein QXF44_00455 [Candidatus Bathyarchaeia archaeon]